MAIVVNLYGAPSSGKSTGAAYIFALLKMKGINAELVTEFAKDKVWEKSEMPFHNQAYLFGQQSFRISRCADKVDVIVTDSPLPLSIIYNDKPSETFNKYVFEIYNENINLNYFLKRAKPYNPVGRFQTEKEADNVSIKIKELLNEYHIDYTQLEGTEENYTVIANMVMNFLEVHRKEKESQNEYI